MAHCEQCGRETDYLFKGTVTTQATQYGFPQGQRGRPKVKPVGLIDVQREGDVCAPCRPPSNLEIEEILAGPS